MSPITKTNPPAKSEDVLVVCLFVLHNIPWVTHGPNDIIGFRVAGINASNETYFKPQELPRLNLYTVESLVSDHLGNSKKGS